MKILLDENLPKKLKINFAAEHEVYTVREKNWNGKRNGELLDLLTLDDFDASLRLIKTYSISKISCDFRLNCSFSIHRTTKSKL